MSCNPAIGGLGKGHLVREIDALDGLMGRVADAAGIQFRVLNRSKGPAVQGPRSQADRKLYREAMQAAISATPNLEVIEAAVEDLILEQGNAAGIVTADGREIRAGGVVLTTRGGDFELAIGQDISIGYASHTASNVELYLQETFTFRLLTTEAVVSLSPP